MSSLSPRLIANSNSNSNLDVEGESEGDFFQQLILKGRDLKKVDLETVNKRLTRNSGANGGLASALADALAKMRTAINGDDEEMDSDDDW